MEHNTQNRDASGRKTEIKALILPKLDRDELSGSFPGEGQYYYDCYCRGGEEYDIRGGMPGRKLYVKDGVALYVTGMGKVNAALAVLSVLSDSRFDFRHALILGTGCGGAAAGYGVMGDVYVVSATVDGELGHTADSRELTNPAQRATWYHDARFDSSAFKILDPELISKVYDLVKDVKLNTTEHTKQCMAAAFPGEKWAERGPRVLRGTSVTMDNYWKGTTGHANALLAVKTYGCPDPYAVSEMEDNAVAVATDRLGLLAHLVILRHSVNIDVFLPGESAENLWDAEHNAPGSGSSLEIAPDIFETALRSNFAVGQKIIDAVLNGNLTLS